MAIITLTTDFGLKDHFVAVLKGSIYTELPDAKIVDISHDIMPFNIHECAYILSNSYKSFPKGTIHIVGVDSEETPDNKHVVALVFDAYRNGREFKLLARNHKIDKIHNAYNDFIDYSLEKGQRKSAGDLLAIFNSSDYIELAIYKSNLTTVGGASTLLGLDYRDTIMVDFE